MSLYPRNKRGKNNLYFIFFTYTSNMKNLEKDQFEILLNIIGSNPSLQIVHIAQSDEIPVDMLSKHIEKIEGINRGGEY